MDCATCPITIRVALMKVPGVSKAVVSYDRRTAKVTYDDARPMWRR
jgi:mercuric ion binding protein